MGGGESEMHKGRGENVKEGENKMQGPGWMESIFYAHSLQESSLNIGAALFSLVGCA